MTQADKTDKTTTTGAPHETQTTGKGMPGREPHDDNADRVLPGQHPSQRDGSAETSLRMPHERDQSTDMTPDKQSPAVQQAGKDVAKGLKDTSKHPEMDAAYKKQT